MPLLVHACVAAIRRGWCWAADRQARGTRLGTLAFAGAAACLGWWGATLPWQAQVVAWSALLASAMVGLRYAGVHVFGPLLLYDLVRTARRKQQAVLRSLYAGFLLAAFFFVYFVWAFHRDVPIGSVLGQASIDSRALADFAFSFFTTFLGCQFVGACLLTPAWTAGAVTEERATRTLEYLLTTDLTDREIVLSLTLSRLANLALVIVTGLPVLGLLQFLGGVDPDLVLFGFAGTGLTMLSLTALGILVSIYAYHPRQAVLRTYGWALAYLVASGVSWLLLLPALGWATFPSFGSWTSPVTVEDLVHAFNAGNPVALSVNLWFDLQAGSSLDAELPGAIGKYAIAHLLATGAFIAWAVLRFRVAVLAPTPDLVRRALPLTQVRRRPCVGRFPLLWKELFAEPGVRLRSWGRISLAVLFLVSFLPAVGIFYYRFLDGSQWAGFVESMNIWVRGVGTLVAYLALLGVALRAAGSISGERDRQTLDGLLGTPADEPSILLSKWFGAITGPRKGWIWLSLIAAVGIAAGALDYRALPVLALVWLAPAMFLAALGVWFSVGARTTQRALLATLIAAGWFTLGHWLAWVVLLPFHSWFHGSDADLQNVIELQAIGLTPPATFVWLLCPPGEKSIFAGSTWTWAWPLLLQGALIWLGGTVLMLVAGAIRFRESIGRAPIIDLENILARIRRQPTAVRASPRKSYRVRRIVWGGTLVAGLALLFLWRTNPAADPFQEANAEADRLDPGWRLEELEANRKVIPDDKNAALAVPAIPDERMAARLPRWYPGRQWPHQSTDEALRDLPPQARLNELQLRLLTRDLEDVEAALLQARRLVALPDGRAPITYSKDGISTLLPYTQRHRVVAQLLAYDIMLRAQERDADGALASCLACVNAGRAVGDEPTLISMLVRLACRQLALAQIQRALAQCEPSEPALAALQALLQKEDAVPLFLIGIRGERALLDRFMATLDSAGMSMRGVRQTCQMLQADLSPLETVMLATGISVKSQRAALLHFLTRFVEVAKLPIEKQHEALDQLQSERAQLPAIARAMLPEFEKVPQSIARGQALLRSAIVAVALERYRIAHGGYPESLDALVPGLLPSVPKDPFDGQPLRYRHRDDGVVVYSIGPSLQDHGGTILWTEQIWNAKWQDANFGFQLWDVAHRRQAPLPITIPPSMAPNASRPPSLFPVEDDDP